VNKDLLQKIEKQNNQKRTEKLSKIQEQQYKKFNETPFLVLRITRDITAKGEHKRKVTADDEIQQEHALNIRSAIAYEIFNGESYVSATFSSVDAAEEWVKEKVQRAKDFVRFWKEEFKKEKKLKESEEILLL